jgi:hypothetical protein
MAWQITFTSKAAKQITKLLQRERDILDMLVRDLALSGPVLPKWRNYSRLGKDEHHCHLSYQWVVCWRVEDYEVKLIEIYYAGSRENAPY